MAETMATLNKDNADIYSDDEVIIGQVIENGVVKNLYRKEVSATFSSDGSWNFTATGIPSSAVIYGIKGRMYIDNGSQIVFPLCINSTQYVIASFSSDGTLGLNTNYARCYGRSAKVYFDYTK